MQSSDWWLVRLRGNGDSKCIIIKYMVTIEIVNDFLAL